MDPIMKAWMFHNWVEDYADEYKLLENQGYLVGSFINPEAVKKMLGVGIDQRSSTEEEADDLIRRIAESNKQNREEAARKEKGGTGKKKRKRKITE
jgi:hypothetical protein